MTDINIRKLAGAIRECTKLRNNLINKGNELLRELKKLEKEINMLINRKYKLINQL